MLFPRKGLEGQIPSFLKNPTVIITLVAIVFGGGFYFYNNYREKQAATAAKTAQTQTATTTTPIVDLTNTDPTEFTTELKNELALANSKAIAYDSQEVLSGVEITIPGALVPRSGNSTYIYDSPTETSAHFTINIAQATQNFIRAVIPKEDYLSDLTPITLKSWKYSYVDALKIAEKNGGSAWRSKNTLSQLKMTLRNALPKGWLYWIINYQSDSSGLQLQVDAYTGRFVPDTEIEAAKAATATPTTNDQSTNTP